MSLYRRDHGRRAARQMLTRRAERRQQYRLVVTLDRPDGPLLTANPPASKQQALQQWKSLVSLGAYGPHEHRRAQVMTDADYEAALYATRQRLMAEVHTKALAEYGRKLHDAVDDAHFDRLARLAEGWFSTDLGARMRALVDAERDARASRLAKDGAR